MRVISLTGAIALLLATIVMPSAHARYRHHQRHQVVSVVAAQCAPLPDGSGGCEPATAARRALNSYARSDAGEGAIIGSRPVGCPHAYCGCGLRKYLGLSDVRLNLAHNWARLFPHESQPRAGLAAVRSHHVMYLESSMGGGQWQVRDFNSGGGLSRIHVRDVRGYVFVNPSAVTATK